MDLTSRPTRTSATTGSTTAGSPARRAPPSEYTPSTARTGADMSDTLRSLGFVSPWPRRQQIDEVVAEAHDTLTDLYKVFEARDFGDDEVHDPDDLDEEEDRASQIASKLLAKLVHLLTADNLTDQTTALSV